MHEALQTLLDFGFGVMNLNRVEADIDPRNGASARSLLRLGFRLEGHLRERWIVAGEVSDSALYGLLRAEWRAAPQTDPRPDPKAAPSSAQPGPPPPA
jgi:RimJ/RimL family protein N-acetyltransferase